MSTPADERAAAAHAGGGWKHVHPLTPVLKGGAGALAAIGVLFYIILQNAQNLLEGFVAEAMGGDAEDESNAFFEGFDFLGLLIREHPGIAVGVVGLLLLVLGAVVLSLWLSWRATRYRIDSAGVHLRTGVLAKKERSASHDRVQSVDISLPFVPRLFGLASLVFDVAGGSGSDITVSYLNRRSAEQLREEILAHLRGESGGDAVGSTGASGSTVSAPPQASATGTTTSARADEGTAGEQLGQDERTAAAAAAPLGQRLVSRRRVDALTQHATGVADDLSVSLTQLLEPYRLTPHAEAEGRLLRVPFHRLLGSALLSTTMLISALALLGVIVLIVVLFVFAPPQAAVSTLFGIIPAVFAIVGVLRSELSLANFTVAITQDGLRVSHGLTSTTNRIIPLDRIQAVKLTQPVLWRIPGWWRAEFTIASEAKSDDRAQNVLLPVGGADDVMLMLGLALPDPRPAAGVDARSLVLEGMSGPGARTEEGASTDASANTARGSVVAETQYWGRPPASRWLDPLTRRRNAHALTGTFSLIRSGRFTRRLEFVPHARVQSMRLYQGPLQRRLGLSSIQLHISPGPITPQFFHLRTAEAAQLFAEHADRTRRAREELDADLSAHPQHREAHANGGDA